jgi:hypothetical protein
MAVPIGKRHLKAAATNSHSRKYQSNYFSYKKIIFLKLSELRIKWHRPHRAVPAVGPAGADLARRLRFHVCAR